MSSVPFPDTASGGESPDTFRHTGLEALLVAAEQDCADLVLIRDDAGASTTADIARRVRRLAAHFRLLGLAPRERILILAGAQADAIVALIAALRAGLEPALAGCGLGPVEIAAHARAAEAVALVGPSRYGGVIQGDIYLSAVALAEMIRVVATHGPDMVDGAVDISFGALDAMQEPREAVADPKGATLIATFDGPPAAPTLFYHRQAVLLADALSLVEQARINPSKRIISTLPPSTLAGLVAGPFAAFIGASCLVLHGPFDAAAFLEACDAEPGFHLVGPAVLGRAYETPLLAAPVGSLILVSRFAGPRSFVLPDTIACERPIVDLYAFGEDNVLPQRRDGGVAQPPSRVTDKSEIETGGLGARLNQARASLVDASRGESAE